MSESLRLRATRIRQRLVRTYNSIWFFPIVLILAAIILFALSSAVDASGLSLRAAQPANLASALIFTGSPTASRNVLASIATGWATILGVVFSVTLVTVQLTASNYTPQILSQFEKDKINQLVLGAYVGTVTYSLLVLKTVRVAQPAQDGMPGQTAFAPVVGTNLAILFAVLDLLLLVLYISNLLSFVRPRRFVQTTVGSTIGALGAVLAPRERPWLRPGDLEESERLQDEQRDAVRRREVRAESDGVVARLAWDDLLSAVQREMQRWLRGHEDARGSTWRLHTERKVGDPVSRGGLLAYIVAPLSEAELGRLAGWVQEAYSIEGERRPEEDPGYGVALLSAMGVRAAAGSATQVAVECISGLFGVLNRVASLPSPAPRLVGHVDDSRIVVERPAQDFLEATITAIGRVVDASLSRQLSAVPEEMGTRASALLLHKGLQDPPARLRGLVRMLLPLYRRSLLRLDDARAAALLTDELAAVSEVLTLEEREEAAHILRSALVELEATTGLPAEAAHALRAALLRITPLAIPA